MLGRHPLLSLDENLCRPVVSPGHDLVKSMHFLKTFSKVTDEDEAFLDAMDKRLAEFNEAREIAKNEAAIAETTTGDDIGSNVQSDEEEPVKEEQWGRGRRRISSRFMAVLATVRDSV